MKIRLFFAAALLATVVPFSCGNKPADPDPTPEPVSKEFVSDGSYNADFVIAISDAYEEFVETDELPNSVNVQGLNYTKAKYTAAGCLLLEKMISDPDSWQKGDIDIPKMSAGEIDQNNTFWKDSVSFEDVRWMAKRIYDYALEHYNYFPNYCTFPDPYLEDDGTQHDAKMTYRNCAVVIARVFNEYVKNSEFPKTVSSWQSDFLRKTSNCETDSPIVLAARDEALKSLPSDATTRQKAEALFNYSRDEWEWLDYSNTARGSVKVVQQKGGNCCDLSHALIAMTRATGIPARYMHGQCQYSKVIGHVFVQIYVDGKWFICDPSNNSNQFGTHNWSHMVTFNGLYKTLPF